MVDAYNRTEDGNTKVQFVYKFVYVLAASDSDTISE